MRHRDHFTAAVEDAEDLVAFEVDLLGTTPELRVRHGGRKTQVAIAARQRQKVFRHPRPVACRQRPHQDSLLHGNATPSEAGNAGASFRRSNDHQAAPSRRGEGRTTGSSITISSACPLRSG